MTAIVHDVDLRQELLGRIRTHQGSINTYVRKIQHRRDLVANISIVSSSVAAALMLGPGTEVVGAPFVETVQNGLGFQKDSSVWGWLCLTALIVNVVAAISASLSKSNDPTESIVTAQACNAALEELGTDVEFSKHSVKIAAAEYGKIAAKILFVAADSADDADAYSNNGATVPPPSRLIDRYRRSLEVVVPGMAIVFGCIILLTMMIAFVRGTGVAEARPPASLVLPVSPVKIGKPYSATASGFSSGEIVKFSWWSGSTSGPMDMDKAPPADSSGSTILGGINETQPPGKYTVIATGQTSHLTASAELVVQRGN